MSSMLTTIYETPTPRDQSFRTHCRSIDERLSCGMPLGAYLNVGKLRWKLVAVIACVVLSRSIDLVGFCYVGKKGLLLGNMDYLTVNRKKTKKNENRRLFKVMFPHSVVASRFARVVTVQFTKSVGCEGERKRKVNLCGHHQEKKRDTLETSKHQSWGEQTRGAT